MASLGKDMVDSLGEVGGVVGVARHEAFRAVRDLNPALLRQALGRANGAAQTAVASSCDHDGQSLLHLVAQALPVPGSRLPEVPMPAAPRTPLPLLQALLAAAADAGARDHSGETPLHSAVRAAADAAVDCTDSSKERFVIVRNLLDAAVDVNAASYQQKDTPLMEAASAGDMALCQVLLFARADPSQANDQGVLAEDFVDDEHSDLKAVLMSLQLAEGERMTPEMEAHADPPTAVPPEGPPPAAATAPLPSPRTQAPGMEAHADPPAAMPSEGPPPAAAAAPLPPPCVQACPRLPADLLQAVERCHAPSVRRLLKAGGRDSSSAALHTRDDDGHTLLHIVSMAPPSDVAFATAACLVSFGAPLDARNLLGETPLLLATRAALNFTKSLEGASLQIIRCLLESRAEVDTPDDVNGENPLIEAVCHGSLSLCRLLLERHADVHYASHSGATALEFANAEAHPDVARLLCEAAGTTAGACLEEEGVQRKPSKAAAPEEEEAGERVRDTAVENPQLWPEGGPVPSRAQQLREECRAAGYSDGDIAWCSGEDMLKRLLEAAQRWERASVLELKRLCTTRRISITGIFEKAELTARLRQEEIWSSMPEKSLRESCSVHGIETTEIRPSKTSDHFQVQFRSLSKTELIAKLMEAAWGAFACSSEGPWEAPAHGGGGGGAGAGAEGGYPKRPSPLSPPLAKGGPQHPGISKGPWRVIPPARPPAKAPSSAGMRQPPGWGKHPGYQHGVPWAARKTPVAGGAFGAADAFAKAARVSGRSFLGSHMPPNVRFNFGSYFQGSRPSPGGAPGSAEVSKSSLNQHYRTLGVEPGACWADVQHAYRKLALKYHPDKNNGSEEATAMFKRVVEAYDGLRQHLQRTGSRQ